ncbi:MAG: hypothetical protein ABJP34_03300 [Erythrobacter sp.]
MSNQISRRMLLRGSAAGLAAISIPVRAHTSLRLPDEPMVLTRKLVRDLKDGEAITVTRQWTVNFQRKARSIEIAGRQISAQVKAPAKLRQLAKIEEERDASDLFPIILSKAGTIMMGGRKHDEAALAKAVHTAREMIESSHRSASDKAAAQQHLQQMQRASQPLLDTMPKDLFFPSEPPLHDVVAIDLPNGSVGEFELRYTAHTAQKAAWLDHAERQIITRTGQTERRSSELWSLRRMTGQSAKTAL